MSPRLWRPLLLGAGAVYMALAVWAAVDSASFAAVVADYGPRNVHLVRDFAACAGTFGLSLILASNRPAWRAPALTLTAVWNSAHAIGHLIDINQATPYFVGPLEAGILVVAAIGFATLAYVSIKEEINDKHGA